MAIVWVVIAVIALAVIGWGLEWRKKNQAEAVKRYILETTEVERQLALMNPRLARGEKLTPQEQVWLEKMLFERRITSDPTKWVRPDLGYDAISGTLGEFFATYWASGGSPGLLVIKSEEERRGKMGSMIAENGNPKSPEENNNWWSSHSKGGDTKNRNNPELPRQRVLHAAVVHKPPTPALNEAA